MYEYNISLAEHVASDLGISERLKIQEARGRNPESCMDETSERCIVSRAFFRQSLFVSIGEK